MVGFALSCFGLLLFLWLAFGGPIPLKPKGYRINASFAQASQLATEADVRISGVPVGKVKAIEPDAETGRADVTMELQATLRAAARDARAILRQKTLLGETYVELTPGTRGRAGAARGRQPARRRVSDTVELDEILRTFDPQTREAFQEWTQTQARGDRRPRARHQRRARQPRAVRGRRRRARRHPQPPAAGGALADLQHRRRVRRADRARRPAARR